MDSGGLAGVVFPEVATSGREALVAEAFWFCWRLVVGEEVARAMVLELHRMSMSETNLGQVRLATWSPVWVLGLVSVVFCGFRMWTSILSSWGRREMACDGRVWAPSFVGLGEQWFGKWGFRR